MQLVVFGLNHRTAPVEVREEWALSADESHLALTGLRGQAGSAEHLILSTCNRTEFYSHFPPEFSPHADTDGPSPPSFPGQPLEAPPASSRSRHSCDLLHRGTPSSVEFYRQFYRQVSDVFGKKKAQSLDPSHFYLHRQASAVEHLFRLAGGLDSMILGESQILKQIKDAFAIAQGAQTAGKFFNRLFPAALRVGKRVRALTQISKGCITPGQAALKLAKEVLGDLSQRSLLVIGSGKIGALAAQAFQDEKITTCYVVNRTPKRARRLVEMLGTGTAVPWSQLLQTLAQADLVVSSTGAVDPIVSVEAMSQVQKERGERPMVVVDLAIPRDFDPSVRAVPGVHLFNIDDLNRVIQENADERHAHIPRVEEIVREEIRVFQSWMIYSQVDPVLRHLVERFEQIRLGELQACISQFPAEYHALLDQLTISLVKKLLHFPIEKLKSLRDLRGLNDTEVAFLNRLFLPGS